MNSLLNFDRVQHQRNIDAARKAAAIQQMASKPRRQAFAVHDLQVGKSREATGKPADDLEVVPKQTLTRKTVTKKVVACLPMQPGGLHAIFADGSVFGHARKVPDEIRESWGFKWAYKAVTAEDLEYFESLTELRAHALSLLA